MREITVARCTTHGMTNAPGYHIWNGIKQRCYYPKHKDYANYGGRGIRFHEPWRRSFAAFIKAVGPRPSRFHTIDRIDADGHYEPGNVRWANHLQQSQGRRNTIRVTMPDGKNVCLREAARLCGADYGAVRYAVGRRGEEPLSACQRLGSGIRIKSGPRRH